MVLLYSQQHYGNNVIVECTSSQLDKTGTPLIRLVHPCRREISIKQLSNLTEIDLTLQAYKGWRSTKVGQIMFIECAFNLCVKEHWVMTTTLILQPNPDVAPELIVLREYRYHRDLKIYSCQSQFAKT
jgi:hypothetical protein